MIPKCPNCGHTTVEYKYSTSTLMGWSHIIQDGVDISHDPNWHTDYYTCCKCHHNFHISRRDETEEITDDGPSPEVPIVDTPITVPNEPDTINKDNFLVKSSNFDNSVTIATSEEFKDLKLEMEEMNGYMSSILTELRCIYSALAARI